MAHDRLLDARVTLLGGSGFLGRHVTQELLARGARLTVASRHPKRAFALKPLGNLGQMRLVGCDVTNPDMLAAALAGADAVVNLVGAFDGDLDGLQGRGVGRIAKAAREAGAQAFVHISANGADPESPVDYARTKGEGEEAVLAAFPSATILRPSIVFGPDDMFVNRFAGLIAMLPFMPVFGPEAKLQPVFVDDVAEAVAAALGDAAHAGKTYELCGPEVMTMLELNQRIAKAQCRDKLFAPLPDALSGAIALATGWAPGAPITHDQWRLLKAGNIASGKLPGLDKLGIAPRPLGLFLDRWMVRFRKHGRFGDKAATSR